MALLACGGLSWGQVSDGAIRDLPAAPERDANSLKDYAQPLPERVAPNSYTKPAPPPPPLPPPPPPAPVPTHLQALQQQYDAPAAQPATDAAPAFEGPALGSMALRTAMWLGVICAAIILLSLLLRKAGRRTPLLAGQQFGSVLGRLYLTPKTALHFVRSGDRVLVIGVTQNAVSLITEFDAESFLAPEDKRESENTAPHGFISRLQGNLVRMDRAGVSDDDDIAALRSDIERLREHLQERVREKRD